MKLVLATALLSVLAVAPAAAQTANTPSANVDIDRRVALPADVKCRLGLVNPRGCIPPRAQPQAHPKRGAVTGAAPHRTARR